VTREGIGRKWPEEGQKGIPERRANVSGTEGIKQRILVRDTCWQPEQSQECRQQKTSLSLLSVFIQER
jgi:hypothetical protein